MLKNFPGTFPVSAAAANASAMSAAGKIAAYVIGGIILLCVGLSFLLGNPMKILAGSLNTLPLVFGAVAIGLFFGFFRNAAQAAKMQFTLDDWGISHEFKGANELGRPMASGARDKHGRYYEQRIAWQDVGRIKIKKSGTSVRSRKYSYVNGNGEFTIPAAIDGYADILAILRQKAGNKIVA